MRRLVATGASLVLILATATPADAYTHWGWFNTSAIDSNRDGQADLSVCYGTSSLSPVYTNRSALAEEFTRWHPGAQLGAWTSNGLCNNDGSNVQVLAADLGNCEVGELSVPGETDDLGNTGYSQISFWFNSRCYDDFDWQDDDGIADNKFSATATGLHEMGHALGLNHSGNDAVVMFDIGPVHCPLQGHDWTLAFDDADGYRDRYPGLTDSSTGYNAAAGCHN